MAYLEDYEKRILFSALAREKKICRTIDRLEPPKGTPLVKIVESLERKFYYNRFEKEIRAKAIDEFAEEMKWEYRESIGTSEREIHFALAVIDQVAERLNGVQE